MRFIVRIGTDGKPIGCDVLQSSGTPGLDERTCFLVMTRANFYAARDANGDATTGTYTNSIRWLLPLEANKLLSPKSDMLSFVVEKSGKIVDCKITATGDGAAEAMQAMTPCSKNASIQEPFRDENGNAVAKRVIIRSSTEVEDVK